MSSEPGLSVLGLAVYSLVYTKAHIDQRCDEALFLATYPTYLYSGAMHKPALHFGGENICSQPDDQPCLAAAYRPCPHVGILHQLLPPLYWAKRGPEVAGISSSSGCLHKEKFHHHHNLPALVVLYPWTQVEPVRTLKCTYCNYLQNLLLLMLRTLVSSVTTLILMFNRSVGKCWSLSAHSMRVTALLKEDGRSSLTMLEAYSNL